MTNSIDGNTQDPVYIPANHAGDGPTPSLKSEKLVSSEPSQQNRLKSDVPQSSEPLAAGSFQSIATDFSSDHFESIPQQSQSTQEPTQQPADSKAPLSSAESDRTVVSASPIAEAQEFYPAGSVASLARVLVGQQLDHYQLHELVGGGGMGAVFKASDTRLDRIVAVKVIPNLGRDQESLKRFRVEAQSAAKLDHPNIARVYYVGETAAWSYIVFEFVEGVNLRDLVIRNAAVSIDEAIHYTIQIAQALQHASERGIVHRDIKPSNALVTSSDDVKVVDMGLARTTSLDQSTNDLTASGVTLGTFDYISPEQARDPRAADVRSDLYSLGCTLYYLLSGRPPYYQGTAIQKLLMHGETPPEDPRHFRDDIPAELLTVIRKLMSKRPRDRYQQPVDLVLDLQSIARAYDLPKSQIGNNAPVTAPVASSRWFHQAFPWLVSLTFLLASSFYLYRKHLDSSDFSITQEIITEATPIDEPLTNNADKVLLDSTQVITQAIPQAISAHIANLNITPSPVAPTPVIAPRSASRANLPPSTENIEPPALGSTNSDKTTNETVLSVAAIVDSENMLQQPDAGLVVPRPQPTAITNNELSADEIGSKLLSPDAIYTTSNQGTFGLSTIGEGSNRTDPKLSMIGTQPTGIKVAIAPPNVVIVRRTPSPPQQQIESFSSIIDPPVVASLSDAINLANTNFEIDEIWIDEDQIVFAQGIKVRSPRLVIRSKSGQLSRIIWHPVASPQIESELNNATPSSIYEDDAMKSRIAMIELENSKLTLQDVDIQVSSPESGEGKLSFASLTAGSQLKLANSAVTLLPNVGDWKVAFAFVGSKPSSDPPQITLENAIVRGTGSLVQMDAGTRSELRWSNGLLSIDGWLLETNGATVASKTPQTIRMDLQDLTMDAQLGLARVNLTHDDPHPLCISRDAKNCTFICSADAPLVSIEGVSWNDSSELTAILPSWIDLRGADNAYDEQVNTIIRLQGMSGITKQIGFEASSLGIFSERAPETTVRWSDSFDSNKPFDQRIPNDYRQETSTSFRSGMRIDALPLLQ
ncbi:MAG: serine/threonine-protein kinase [Planctomycetota bacterium]|nr:serine/threonine-protein kinase [Planctomycetota bacterium]